MNAEQKSVTLATVAQWRVEADEADRNAVTADPRSRAFYEYQAARLREEAARYEALANED